MSVEGDSNAGRDDEKSRLIIGTIDLGCRHSIILNIHHPPHVKHSLVLNYQKLPG
jgi:hypothetical protein